MAALISRFCSPQPDTSLLCETMDTGLMHCVACLCTPRLSPVPNYILLGDLVTEALGREQLALNRSDRQSNSQPLDHTHCISPLNRPLRTYSVPRVHSTIAPPRYPDLRRVD